MGMRGCATAARRFLALAGLVLAGVAPLAGCFAERSFPIQAQPPSRLTVAEIAACHSPRSWLRAAHVRLAGKIDGRTPLLTDDLTSPDGSVSVGRHFGIDETRNHTLLANYSGLKDSAVVSGSRFVLEAPPAWPGFEDIEVPIRDGVTLAGRYSLARRAGPSTRANCIVVMAGLFGDNWTLRSRDVSLALRDAGFHVLALEPRGHGRTETLHPDVPFSFGTIEAGDLLDVAEWLEARPEVVDTGLVGFCWSANVALLAGWENGRDARDPAVTPALAALQRGPGSTQHFRAGIAAFSPPLDFEAVVRRIEARRPRWMDPTMAALSEIVDQRAASKGYGDLGGSLWRLIEREVFRLPGAYPDLIDDGLQYIRFVAADGKPLVGIRNKLEALNVPTLIVHAANDPVAPAQPLADLIAGTENPNVAALVLPGGGHCGFTASCPDYFYGLLLGFFDRDSGAAAVSRRSTFVALPASR
jgi:predicted alpha/beta-fold hydrolase